MWESVSDHGATDCPPAFALSGARMFHAVAAQTEGEHAMIDLRRKAHNTSNELDVIMFIKKVRTHTTSIGVKSHLLE